jgi:hypothetical protein
MDLDGSVNRRRLGVRVRDGSAAKRSTPSFIRDHCALRRRSRRGERGRRGGRSDAGPLLEVTMSFRSTC